MKNYIKQTLQPMTPWTPESKMDGVSVWDGDTPEIGGMIAVNPKDPQDVWYVSKAFFDANYALADEPVEKTLGNTDQDGCKKNVPDVVMFGGDLFELLSKASSKAEGWMKSTKAMQTDSGVVVQVTTQQRNPDGSYAVAEALSFIPSAVIITEWDDDGKVPTGRWIK